jgi:hypothetical protein
MLAEPLPFVAASTAVTVQGPAMVEAIYVTDTWPVASVRPPPGVNPPQDGPGWATNATGSPATTAPVRLLTVAVTIEVLVPSAGIIGGTVVTATAFGDGGGGFWVWIIVTNPFPPDTSRAVTAQNPTVVDEV